MNSHFFPPYESFRHGLIASKLWLCEELEKYTPNKSTVHILGAWTNVLGFMLAVRKASLYEEIHGYDIDPTSIEIADQICETWKIESPKIINHVIDVNTIDFSSNRGDVFINCSGEHMDNDVWFDNLPKGSIVCIQSTNVQDSNEPWFVKQPVSSLEDFSVKYDLFDYYYVGKKRIQYDSFGYDRYMMIGLK